MKTIRVAFGGDLRKNERRRLSDAEIVRRYRDGYGKFPPVEDELNGWEEEQAWPS